MESIVCPLLQFVLLSLRLFGAVKDMHLVLLGQFPRQGLGIYLRAGNVARRKTVYDLYDFH
jgi:hypothetical protein